MTVLISDYFEYYRLAAYLARNMTEPIAVTMGVANLLDLFNEKYYTELMLDPATGIPKTDENAEIPAAQHNLFRHMVGRGRIKQLDNFDKSVLHIFSRDV